MKAFKSSMPRVEVVYDFRNEAARKGSATIHVRITHARKRTYISTGVRVSPDQWHPEWHVCNRDDATALNMKIDSELVRVKEQVRRSIETESPMPTAEQIKVKQGSAPFLDWLEEQFQEANVCSGTRKHYQTMLTSLTDFGKIRKFEHVTTENLQAYVAHLSKRTVNIINEKGKPDKRRVAPSCVRNHFKQLAKWIRVAQQQRRLPKGVMMGVKLPKEERRHRKRLYDAELAALMNAPLASPHLIRARDTFLVQCATGLAYSDLVQMNFHNIQNINGHYVISGARHKTDNNFFAVVLPFGMQILERYNYNLPTICLQDYNRFLKSIAKIAGIQKKVTSHIGRHTYACLALSGGVRMEVVQKALGHAKISTTQIYADLVNQDVLNAFDKLTLSPQIVNSCGC